MTMLHRTPFNPWRDLDRLLMPKLPELPEHAWMPAFDIEETDDAYVLRGDVPGTAQKDIEVRFDDGILTVRGERTAPEAEVRFRRSERSHGRFERRFRLPEEVDPEGMKASYLNGVLEITLSKREPVDTSRLIPVN